MGGCLDTAAFGGLLGNRITFNRPLPFVRRVGGLTRRIEANVHLLKIQNNSNQPTCSGCAEKAVRDILFEQKSIIRILVLL